MPRERRGKRRGREREGERDGCERRGEEEMGEEEKGMDGKREQRREGWIPREKREGRRGERASMAARQRWEGLGRAPGPRRGAPRTWVVGNAPRRAASGCTRPGEHGARGVTHRRRTAPSSGPRSFPLSWDRSWTTGCCNCQSRCSCRRRRRRNCCLAKQNGEGDLMGGVWGGGWGMEGMGWREWGGIGEVGGDGGHLWGWGR